MTTKSLARLAVLVALGALLSLPAAAPAQETIRIGCPTKTYFPTILATVAKEKGLFEKEGLRPEITIYRGGGETFAAVAAKSAGTGRAAVIYSPLSYQVVSEGKVRVLMDFATAMPPNLIGGWAATEKNLTERRPFIQKGLNALYGALEYLRNNPDYAIKTIAANNELP